MTISPADICYRIFIEISSMAIRFATINSAPMLRRNASILHTYLVPIFSQFFIRLNIENPNETKRNAK